MLKPYPFLLCLVLTACATQLGIRDQKTKRLTMFSQVVFAPDYDSRRTDRLAKWTIPLRIVVRGEPGDSYINYIKSQVRSLADVSGLDIKIVKEDKPSNVSIYFASDTNMETLAGSDIRNRERLLANLRSSGCHFYIDKDGNHRITAAAVFIRIGKDVSTAKTCITQELTHILGLANDSNLIQPSIFNSTDYLKQPTALDLKFIRALYSPALTPGMTRRDALIEVEKLL